MLCFIKKYLKFTSQNENSYSYGIIYTDNLKHTKNQIGEYFPKKNKFDKEVKKLLFYTKDNYLELNKKQSIITYLIELIDTIEKEKE